MSELEALENLHRAAQARLGLAVAMKSTSRWEAVQALNPARTAAGWANEVATAVLEAQQLSVLLAQTYYQLARALELGITLGYPKSDGEALLGTYRDDFLAGVLQVSTLGEDSTASDAHAAVGLLPELKSVDLMPSVQKFLDEMDEERDSEAVSVDRFDWVAPRASHDAIRRLLTDEAVDPLIKDVDSIKGKGDRANKVALLEDSHSKKGSIGAGLADSTTMHAGRLVLERAHNSDKRVLKYARGTGANPCAFCAMLAARGFVYASSQVATKSYQDGGLRSYHPHCHCYPIARWVESSPLPATNSRFQQLWNTHIQGKYKGGPAARRAWRQLLTRMQLTPQEVNPIETD